MIKKTKTYIFKNNNWYEIASPDLAENQAPKMDVYKPVKEKVGTWIDGRTIYRKVITGVGNPPIVVPFEFFTTIVDAKMMIKNTGSEQAWRPIPWTFDGNDLNWYGGFRIQETNKQIVLQLGNQLKQIVYWHIIIDYCIDP